MYPCIIVPYQCHHRSSTQRHAAASQRQAELWFSYKLPDAGGCLWRCSGVSLDLGASEAAWSSQSHCCAPATTPRNTTTARGAWCKAAFNQLFWYHCVKRYQINSNTSELIIVLFCPWNDCQWLVPSPRGVPSSTIRDPALDLQLSVMKWLW